MTDYIEQMMETAGVKKRIACDGTLCAHDCSLCEMSKLKYPPFTAEKQLEIIKLIFKNCFVNIQDNTINYSFHNSPITYTMNTTDFSQNLAALVNNLWKYISDEDKEKVKEILEDAR